MNALEDTGHIEDTIVVFLSDHGDNLGSHGLFNKDVLLEESVRIPLIFRWPAVLAPGVHRERLAQTIDVMPTLLGLCGITVPDTVQGVNLAPAMESPGVMAPDNHVFIEADANQIGIRTPTHLYGFGIDPFTHEVTQDPVYFFDVKNDPYQMHNLADTAEQPQIGQKLQARLHQWHEQTPWLKVEDV